MMSDEEIKKKALKVLLGNRKRGYSKWAKTRYDFSCPSRRTYPYQWFWDSCFHIIALSHLDPDLAKKELASLFRGQRPDGFMPHIIFWDRGVLKPKLYRFTQSAGWSLRPKWTGMIQPPVLGIAIEKLYEKTNEKEILREFLPKAARYYDWLREYRDPDGDHLISIITPYESGLDYAPHFDEVVGFHTNNTDRKNLARLEIVYRRIDLKNKLHGYNSKKILELDYFNVEDVMVNTLYSVSLRSISRLFTELKETESSRRFEAESRLVEKAILEKCYDEKTGLFWSLSGGKEKRLKTKTFVSLMPIMLENLPKNILHRLIKEHLTNSSEFWPEYPVPTVSLDDPRFDPDDNHYIWRGPTWINSNWFLVEGLKKHGENDIAKEIVTKTKAAIEKSGFREYFNPFTAEGGGAYNFGWSTLVVNMLE